MTELHDKDGNLIPKKKGYGKNKVSDIEIIERVGAVYQGLMDGWSRSKLIQYGSKVWDVGDRQIDSYISRAKAIVLRDVTKNMVYDYKLAILRLNELYEEAKKSGTFADRKSILADIHKIQGLYTTKIDVTMGGEVNVKHDLAKKTPKELKDHIRKLRAANKKRRKELGLDIK